MRTCRSCGEDKPDDAFRVSKGYRERQCYACFLRQLVVKYHTESPEERARRRRTGRAWARSNPKKIRLAQLKHWKTHYGTTRGRAAQMHHASKDRAKKLGVEFALTREWIEERLRAGVCEATGLPLVVVVGTGLGHNITNPYAPSMERINPRGPYTPENCMVTCWIYNRAKGAWSDDDFVGMCRAVVERADRLRRKDAA